VCEKSLCASARRILHCEEGKSQTKTLQVGYVTSDTKSQPPWHLYSRPGVMYTHSLGLHISDTCSGICRSPCIILRLKGRSHSDLFPSDLRTTVSCTSLPSVLQIIITRITCSYSSWPSLRYNFQYCLITKQQRHSGLPVVTTTIITLARPLDNISNWYWYNTMFRL